MIKFNNERCITLRVTKVQITGNGKQYAETLLSSIPMEKFSKKKIWNDYRVLDRKFKQNSGE